MIAAKTHTINQEMFVRENLIKFVQLHTKSIYLHFKLSQDVHQNGPVINDTRHISLHLEQSKLAVVAILHLQTQTQFTDNLRT